MFKKYNECIFLNLLLIFVANCRLQHYLNKEKYKVDKQNEDLECRDIFLCEANKRILNQKDIFYEL